MEMSRSELTKAITKEQREQQRDYLIAMHLMKEMKTRGILTDEDLVKIEKVMAKNFKPYLRYKDEELRMHPPASKCTP